MNRYDIWTVHRCKFLVAVRQHTHVLVLEESLMYKKGWFEQQMASSMLIFLKTKFYGLTKMLQQISGKTHIKVYSFYYKKNNCNFTHSVELSDAPFVLVLMGKSVIYFNATMAVYR